MTFLIDMYTDSKNICYPWIIDEYKSKSVSTVHNSISITIHGACAHIHNCTHGGLYPWENMCLTDAWVQILMSMSMDTEISIHRLSMHFPKVHTSNPKIISELCIKATESYPCQTSIPKIKSEPYIKDQIRARPTIEINHTENATETHGKGHHRAMPQSTVTEQKSQPELQRIMS